MSYQIKVVSNVVHTFYEVYYFNKKEIILSFVRRFSTREEAQAFIEGIQYADDGHYKAVELSNTEYAKAYERYLQGY